MISNDDIYKEINVVEKAIENKVSDDDFKRMMLKLNTLQLKLLHNLRTNTVLVMKKFNVQTIEPKRKDSNVEEKK